MWGADRLAKVAKNRSHSIAWPVYEPTNDGREILKPGAQNSPFPRLESVVLYNVLWKVEKGGDISVNFTSTQVLPPDSDGSLILIDSKY